MPEEKITSELESAECVKMGMMMTMMGTLNKDKCLQVGMILMW